MFVSLPSLMRLCLRLKAIFVRLSKKKYFIGGKAYRTGPGEFEMGSKWRLHGY
jgi:hypothetical protein